MISNFQSSRNVESISIKDLQDYNPYTLIDVRPDSEYDNHHIEGAVHISIEDLESQLPYLNKGNTIISYCRGPFCSLADEAVEILQKNGFNSYRLEESALDA